VGHDIAHITHESPRQIRGQSLNILRDVDGGFANDNEVLQHSLDDGFILAKRVKAQTGSAQLNALDSVENVLNTV
jgi:hypothetical protein